MLDAKAREALAGFYRVTGRALARAGFTPNSLTLLGMAVTAVAAWRIAVGAFLAGGILLAVGGFLDIFDGAVAKAKGTDSKLGAFFDSVSDRVSDALVFGALAWFFFTGGGGFGDLPADEDRLMGAVTLAAFVFSGLTSYIRAKAESQGFDCRVGILERAERLILLCAGLILGLVEIAVSVIAVLGAVTVGQRVRHVIRQARAGD